MSEPMSEKNRNFIFSISFLFTRPSFTHHRGEHYYDNENDNENSVFPFLSLNFSPFLCVFHLLLFSL